MNRRGFFTSLAAAATLAVARNTYAQTAITLVDDPPSIGQRYAEHLARSLIETKETLVANLMNRVYSYGYNETNAHV